MSLAGFVGLLGGWSIVSLMLGIAHARAIRGVKRRLTELEHVAYSTRRELALSSKAWLETEAAVDDLWGVTACDVKKLKPLPAPPRREP